MLSEAERADVRRHMGYGGVQQASTFDLGVPAPVQTAFLIEPAMQRLLPESEPVVRSMVSNLNGIEQQFLDNQDAVVAAKVGTIEVNLKEFEDLLKRYKYWQGALANLLQVTPNPFDMRPGLGQGYSGGGGMNAPVVG